MFFFLVFMHDTLLCGEVVDQAAADTHRCHDTGSQEEATTSVSGIKAAVIA